MYAIEGTMQTAQGSNYGDGFLTGGAVAGKPLNDPAPFFNVRRPGPADDSKMLLPSTSGHATSS